MRDVFFIAFFKIIIVQIYISFQSLFIKKHNSVII